jgi:exopolysaccharide biosynthesis polyprenyl glycosylphosphotransferase
LAGKRKVSYTGPDAIIDGAKRATRRDVAATHLRVRPSQRRLLIIWDVLVVLTVLTALAALGEIEERQQIVRTMVGLILVGLGPLMVYLTGGYLRTRRPLGNLPIEFGRLLSSSGFSIWLAAVVIEATGGSPRIASLSSVWFAITAGWLVGRLLAARRIRNRPERAVVLGSGVVADRIIELSHRHPEHGIRILGVIDDDPQGAPGGPPVLGGVEDMPRLLSTGDYDRVIVAFSDSINDAMLAQTLRVCTPRGVRVDVVPRLFQLVGHDAHLEALGDMSLVQVGAPTAGMARMAAKRLFDVSLAGGLLLIASPVMLAVAIAVKAGSPGPALFHQTRVGRAGRTFKVIKFRSMRVDADTQGAGRRAAEADSGGYLEGKVADLVAALKTDNDDRVTRVGRFIRATSLDELPQLWNVVRGDMSLVGPRPLRPFEAAALNPWQAARHEVRPGVTGLWQVLGRSDIDWEQRMQMDYSYVRHWSLRQDVRVLARTAKVVLSRKGSA